MDECKGCKLSNVIVNTGSEGNAAEARAVAAKKLRSKAAAKRR